MATDDRQILVAGTATAPAQWTVPGNGQVQPKAIYAQFNGGGASSPFFPVVKVVSDGGEFVGIYPTNVTVAAGGTAVVSWFPHVGEAAPGSSGGGGPVQSISAGDTSIAVTYADPVNPSITTGPLDAIASLHPPVSDWSNNSRRISNVTDPTLAQDAATKNYADGKVASVTAADTSVVVGGTATAPTVRTATLDVIAADHPPAADWSNNSNKITSVKDPTLAQDAATKNYVDTHSGSGTITDITSTGSTITVTSPTGPTTNVDLPTTGVTAGTYGTSTAVPVITVDAEGRLTAASTTAVGPSAAYLLFSSVLSGNAASIDTGANGIAGTYNILEIFIVTRTNDAGAGATVLLTFNNDGNANYVRTLLQNVNTTLSGNTGTGATSISLDTHGNGGTASVPGVCTITVPAYASTTFDKTFRYETSRPDGTAANNAVVYGAGVYLSTAAISRLKVAASGAANLLTGSAIYIYGR